MTPLFCTKTFYLRIYNQKMSAINKAKITTKTKGIQKLLAINQANSFYPSGI